MRGMDASQIDFIHVQCKNKGNEKLRVLPNRKGGEEFNHYLLYLNSML